MWRAGPRRVADGADLLGVAGGDGTQALVAGIAAEHGLPFLVISAGTRNHFALDLGLDRDDPATCLDALSDGVELQVDLGVIGDRTFVNNASFGAYAEVVRSPAYRDDKRGTTLRCCPTCSRATRAPGCRPRPDRTKSAPAGPSDQQRPVRDGRRRRPGHAARMDSGRSAWSPFCRNAREAVELCPARSRPGLTVLAADEVVVDADVPQIPVGIDGETVMMPTPVRCAIRPRALRVIVPRQRPGVPAAKPPLEWPRLRQLAAFHAHPDAANPGAVAGRASGQ